MLHELGFSTDSSIGIVFLVLLGIIGLSLWFKKRKQNISKIKSDGPKIEPNREWTSFGFV